MGQPRLDDPLWQDTRALMHELARAGLVTRTKTHGWQLRTRGWQALVALSSAAEREGTAYPGLQRALARCHELIEVIDE